MAPPGPSAISRSISGQNWDPKQPNHAPRGGPRPHLPQVSGARASRPPWVLPRAGKEDRVGCSCHPLLEVPLPSTDPHPWSLFLFLKELVGLARGGFKVMFSPSFQLAQRSSEGILQAGYTFSSNTVENIFKSCSYARSQTHYQ